MSIIFQDGPAVETELECQRAPMFLRVVVDGSRPLKRNGLPYKGAIDCLDLPDDEPRSDERIVVYEALWTSGPVHFKFAPGGRSGYRSSGCYKHRPDVDGEQFRDASTWRAWANAEGAQRLGAVPLSRRVRGDRPTPQTDRMGRIAAHPTCPSPAPFVVDEIALRRALTEKVGTT